MGRKKNVNNYSYDIISQHLSKIIKEFNIDNDLLFYCTEFKLSNQSEENNDDIKFLHILLVHKSINCNDFFLSLNLKGWREISKKATNKFACNHNPFFANSCRAFILSDLGYEFSKKDYLDFFSRD